jgi:hypothetical protein
MSFKTARLLALLGSGGFVLVGATLIGLAAGRTPSMGLGVGIAIAILGCTIVYLSIKAIDRLVERKHAPVRVGTQDDAPAARHRQETRQDAS